MVGVGPGGSLGGKWVQSRTEDDARLLQEEAKLFGKKPPQRSRRAGLILAGVIIVLVLAAVISGFVT